MRGRQVDAAAVQKSSGCGSTVSRQVSVAAGGGLLQDVNVGGRLQRLLPAADCQTWFVVLQRAQAAGASAVLLQAARLRRQQLTIQLAMGIQCTTIH